MIRGVRTVSSVTILEFSFDFWLERRLIAVDRTWLLSSVDDEDFCFSALGLRSFLKLADVRFWASVSDDDEICLYIKYESCFMCWFVIWYTMTYLIKKRICWLILLFSQTITMTGLLKWRSIIYTWMTRTNKENIIYLRRFSFYFE